MRPALEPGERLVFDFFERPDRGKPLPRTRLAKAAGSRLSSTWTMSGSSADDGGTVIARR